MVVLWHIANQLVYSCMGHRFIGSLAGVQVVAAIVALGKCFGIGYMAHGSFEVDTTIEDRRCAQSLIKLLAHLLAILVVCTPTEDRQ